MKRNFHALVVSILAMVAVQWTVAFDVHADIPRYLAPGDLDPGESYGNFVTNFDRDVVDAVKNINAGTIKFDYNTVNGTGTPPTYGGAALAGGFFLNPGITVKPGFSLHWMQLITSQTTYGLGGNTPPYPDVPTNPTYPVYPYESLPHAVAPAPYLPFQDFPSRDWVPGNNEWQAELALTCTSNMVGPNGLREVRMAGSFFWGFEINNDGTNPNHITIRREPGLWGAGVSQEMVNSFNARFRDFVGPPAPGQDRWDFSSNSNCFAIPEPATAFMMLVTMVFVARRRSANSAAQ